jgi:hypothetical protein
LQILEKQKISLTYTFYRMTTVVTYSWLVAYADAASCLLLPSLVHTRSCWTIDVVHTKRYFMCVRISPRLIDCTSSQELLDRKKFTCLSVSKCSRLHIHGGTFYGVGASNTAAHAPWQVPKAALHARMVAGAEAPSVAPHVKPAAE